MESSMENFAGNPARQDKEELSGCHHPVPVVRILIPDREGRLLILRRGSTAYSSGAWCLPGGKIDYGKTAEETLIQELQEETSLECEHLKFLFWQDSLPTEGVTTMHCINFYFECRVSGTIVLNEESSEFAWVRPEDLPKYEVVFRNDIAMLRYWKEREEQHR
jgi:8-oxo-dGTP pyrophosphatase MutT (NUDIX family)